MAKIRSGDEVLVITGGDAGKSGRVLSVKNDRVIVEGVKVVKRATRADPRKNKTGGFESKNAYINISNLKLISPRESK